MAEQAAAATDDVVEVPTNADLPQQQQPPVAATNDPPVATIRPYDGKRDLKLTRYLIGAGVMEPSSLANKAALFKPISLIFCLVSAHLLIVYLTAGYPAFLHNLFASPSHRKPLNPLSPTWQSIADTLLLVPIFLAPPIIVLAVFEMRHRNLFEREMRRTIGEEDLRDINKYYGVKKHTPKSSSTSAKEEEGTDDQKRPQQRKGFWVLEYDDRLLGVVGLDGTKPGQPLDSIMDHIESLKIKKKEKEKEAIESSSSSIASGEPTATSSSMTPATTSTTRSRGAPKSLDIPASESTPMAPSLSVTPPSPSSGSAPSSYALASTPLPDGTLHLRRFTTSMSFRSADIEDDLLSFVANEAFTRSPSSDSSSSSTTPPPARQIVISFRPTIQSDFRRRLEKHGWTIVPRGSELEVPLSGQPKTSSSSSRLTSLIDSVWPLSLEPRTMVLKRSTWEENSKSDAAKAVSSLFGGKGVKVTGHGL